MLTTRFTTLVGCSVPIQQADMGRGIATPRLAAAVANAGGLGMVSVYGDGHTPDVVAQLLDDALRQCHTGPVNRLTASRRSSRRPRLCASSRTRPSSACGTGVVVVSLLFLTLAPVCGLARRCFLFAGILRDR